MHSLPWTPAGQSQPRRTRTVVRVGGCVVRVSETRGGPGRRVPGRPVTARGDARPHPCRVQMPAGRPASPAGPAGRLPPTAAATPAGGQAARLGRRPGRRPGGPARPAACLSARWGTDGKTYNRLKDKTTDGKTNSRSTAKQIPTHTQTTWSCTDMPRPADISGRPALP
jgi:hypothetical protein